MLNSSILLFRLVIGIPLPELQLLHLVPQHILICTFFFCEVLPPSQKECSYGSCANQTIMSLTKFILVDTLVMMIFTVNHLGGVINNLVN